MQRARRLALVVVLALVGGVILAGCRSQPGVAAYVGDKKYTVRQVDEIVDRIVKLNNQRSQEPPDRRQVVPISRQLVLGAMVYGDLEADLLAERGLTAQSGNATAIARSFGLEMSDPYAQLLGTYYDRFTVLAQSGAGTGAAPTRDQLLRYYHAGVEAGVYRAGATDDDIANSRDVPADVLADLGAQALVDQAAKDKHVVVNPRYAPLPLPILMRQAGGGSIVLLPFGGSGASFVSGA